MKKSKIIVPALAVLCLSTAAAVSGTVAWFAAGRTATLTNNSAVINPEGDLQVALTAGTAIAEIPANSKVISMQASTFLRDASVDVGTNPKSPVVYAANIGSDGTAVSYRNVTTDKEFGTVESKNVYFCAEWTAKFTLPNALTSEEFDLYFDGTPTVSKTVANESATEKQALLASAYRVAMYTTSSTHATVYAGRAASSVTYVNSTSTTSSYTPVQDKVTGTASRDDSKALSNYIGTLTGGATGLTVNFIAWFEGSDAACVEANLASFATAQFETSLAFNAIAANGYAA